MTAKNGSNHRITDPAKLREKAKQLLDQAEQIEREKFVKVFPHEYKRILGLARNQPQTVGVR